MEKTNEKIFNEIKNDNIGAEVPITEGKYDRLGLLQYAESLAAYIKTCITPTTVAVQGEWGSGKTSMVNMVLESLEKEKCLCIKFSAWQYSQFAMEDSLQVTFLNRFLNELQEFNGMQDEIRGALDIVKKVTVSLAKKAAVYTANRIGGKELRDVAVEAIDTVVSVHEEDLIKQLRNDILNCIDKILRKGICEKIIVFIDDLDRLSSTKSVEILEVIKIFLDCKGCVFLLAVDTNVVKQGVKLRYGLSEDKAECFYEKLIQAPFYIPVSQYDFNSYANSIWPIQDDYYCDEVFMSEETYEPGSNEVTKILHKDIVALLQMSAENNPRAAKRIVNAFMIQDMGMRAKESAKRKKNYCCPRISKILFALVCIQNKLEPDYEFIMERLGDFSFFKKWLYSKNNIEFYGEELKEIFGYSEEIYLKYQKDKIACGNMILIFKQWCKEYVGNNEEEKNIGIQKLCEVLSTTSRKKWNPQDINTSLIAKSVLNEFEKRLGKIRIDTIADCLETKKNDEDVSNWYTEAKDVLEASKIEIQFLSHENISDKIMELSRGIYTNKKWKENMPDIMDFYKSINGVRFRYTYSKMVQEQFMEVIMHELNSLYSRKIKCENEFQQNKMELKKLVRVHRNGLLEDREWRMVYNNLLMLLKNRLAPVLEKTSKCNEVFDVIKEYIQYSLTNIRAVKVGASIRVSDSFNTSLFSIAFMLDGSAQEVYGEIVDELKKKSGFLSKEERQNLENTLYKNNIWKIDKEQRQSVYKDIKNIFEENIEKDEMFKKYFLWIKTDIENIDILEDEEYEKIRLRWYFGITSMIVYCDERKKENEQTYIKIQKLRENPKESGYAWKYIFQAVDIIENKYLCESEKSTYTDDKLFYRVSQEVLEELKQVNDEESEWIRDDLAIEELEYRLKMARKFLHSFDAAENKKLNNSMGSYELGMFIARYFDKGASEDLWFRDYCCFKENKNSYLWKYYQIFSEVINLLRLRNDEWLKFQNNWGKKRYTVPISLAENDYTDIINFNIEGIFSTEHLSNEKFYEDFRQLGWPVIEKIYIGIRLSQVVQDLSATFWEYFKCIGSLIYSVIPKYMKILDDGEVETNDLIYLSAKKRHQIFISKYKEGLQFLREIADEEKL